MLTLDSHISHVSKYSIVQSQMAKTTLAARNDEEFIFWEGPEVGHLLFSQFAIDPANTFIRK
jgi:hypothetical protein